MPKYVIERVVPGASKMSPAELKAMSQRSCNVLNQLGPQIQWVQSYVTDNKIYCVYIAPNEELVQEHARLGGFPANHVARVSTFDRPDNIRGMSMDLRSIQKPLKEKYRNDPNSSRITLTASSSQTDTPVACSVEVGQKLIAAQAHLGVGGPGTAACSGDLLLGALAACAQLTCQLVATAMGIPIEQIRVEVEGELDLSGTLGISKEVAVGFQEIHTKFEINAPEATHEQLEALKTKTEQYCVVMQTLRESPMLRTSWVAAEN